MNKYRILLVLLSVSIITSCGVDSNISSKNENNEQINSQDKILSTNPESDSSVKNNSNLSTKLEPVNTTSTDSNLISKPNENIDNGLVVKPNENIIDTGLVSKPNENIDNDLVVKPNENLDPDNLVSVITGKGFTDVNFNSGNNNVNLKINFTEFTVLSLISEDAETSHLDIELNMDNNYNKTLKINKEHFENQKFFMIKLKNLKNIENLNIGISAKDKDNKVISSKQIMNEKVNGDKNIDINFSKNAASTGKPSTTGDNSSSNSNTSSNNGNSDKTDTSSNTNSTSNQNDAASTSNGNTNKSDSTTNSNANSNSSSQSQSKENNGKNK